MILDTCFNYEDADFDPMQVAMNFKWENDFTFRVVNKEGFEKLINIETGDAVIKDSTFVPMKDLLNENANSQYYFETFKAKISRTFERLLRKYQRTFTNRQLSIVSKRATQVTEYVLQQDFETFYIAHDYSVYHFKMTQALIKYS